MGIKVSFWRFVRPPKCCWSEVPSSWRFASGVKESWRG